MDNYTDLNAAAIDRWCAAGWEWGRPIGHEDYLRAQKGEWSVLLTPVKPVPKDWFGELAGARVLGLAAGGGQQMPIFAALGAVCTVLDYSEAQLAAERETAEREGYAIEIVRADMSRPLPFDDARFDLIFHPVSNCYIREVEPVWRECHRVLRPGGVLLAGLDNGLNFLVDERDESRIVHRLPFDPLVDPDLRRALEAEDGGMQLSHTLTEQLGGQLRAGFTLADLYEDTNAGGFLHGMNIPAFWATRAVRE